MKKIFAACALASLTFPAVAGSWYVAGDVHQAKWEVDSESESDTGFGLAAGYTINEIFSVELGYSDLGSISESDEDVSASVDLSAIQLSAIASHKVNDTLSVYGRLGYADLKIKASYEDWEYSESESDSKSKAFFGVGASCAINDKLDVRVEWNKYAKYEELEVSTLSLGFGYKF